MVGAVDVKEEETPVSGWSVFVLFLRQSVRLAATACLDGVMMMMMTRESPSVAHVHHLDTTYYPTSLDALYTKKIYPHVFRMIFLW